MSGASNQRMMSQSDHQEQCCLLVSGFQPVAAVAGGSMVTRLNRQRTAIATGGAIAPLLLGTAAARSVPVADGGFPTLEAGGVAGVAWICYRPQYSWRTSVLAREFLDVATGTGAAAKMALDIVGPNGHVTAVDISNPMLDSARKSLARSPNVTFEVQNGEALTLPEASFDTVLCRMALMIFADRASALSGFHRILRRGGSAAASLNTTPARGFTTHVRTALASVIPESGKKINADRAHHYDICQVDRAQALFEAAEFRDVTTTI
jgi:SAM-dependent methyltransferase